MNIKVNGRYPGVGTREADKPKVVECYPTLNG